MQTLILNNGAELANSYAIETAAGLFLYIRSGITLPDAAALLYDPDVTCRIVYANGEDSVTFSGYRRLTAVTDEGRGLITASLKK